MEVDKVANEVADTVVDIEADKEADMMVDIGLAHRLLSTNKRKSEAAMVYSEIFVRTFSR